MLSPTIASSDSLLKPSISVKVKNPDAKWKRIQQNTFTRWVNEHLKKADQSITDLAMDLSDGLKLIVLIEVLSGKSMWKHNKKPKLRTQKLENISIALQFLEKEGVVLVNTDSTHIVDGHIKLILGLIWRLILYYSISQSLNDGSQLLKGTTSKDKKTPKQCLMIWVNEKLSEYKVNNFTSDWTSGKKIGALVDSVAPGLCPYWEDWDPNQSMENATKAMDLASDWLDVPKLLTPEEMISPNIDEQSMMTYLSQFPNSKLKPGAPLREKINANNVCAYGPGIEYRGLVTNTPANFTVETLGAGDGQLGLLVLDQSGKDINCDIVFNNDRNNSYSCSYITDSEGEYEVHVFWSKRVVPKSPFRVLVERPTGDESEETRCDDSDSKLQQRGIQF